MNNVMAMEEELLNRMEVEGQQLLDGVDGRKDVVRVVFEGEGCGEGGRDGGEEKHVVSYYQW